jgi:quercetin dioxygenase-like cupin family protein
MTRVVGLTTTGGNTLPSNLEMRNKIMDLEASMTAMGGDEIVDSLAPVNHYHCAGNYAREIFIPKDTVMVGKIHRHEHINVISQGSCWVTTEEGTELLSAPLTFISLPHIKRAVYAVEDTVWTTIHPTDKTDLTEIEDEVIAPSYEDLNNILEYTT